MLARIGIFSVLQDIYDSAMAIVASMNKDNKSLFSSDDKPVSSASFPSISTFDSDECSISVSRYNHSML
jgi:hypothetical protein